MFTNLLKAAVAVAVTPVDLAVDLVTLPASAVDNTDPFSHTKARLAQADEALDAALKPDDE